MKKLMFGIAMSLSVFASAAQADQVITVDGEEYLLSDLTANCQSITDDPAAQITCFSALSKIMEEQASEAQATDVSVVETLAALQAVAQYEDDDTGLLISGTDCRIHVLYFNNSFHISRRNVSSIDLISAQFDASKLQFDEVSEVRGAQVPLLSGEMDVSATAVMRGGIELDSSRDGFEPRSPRTTLGVYAQEVATVLTPTEDQTFDFVLVHPQRSADSDAIWAAFEAFTAACRKAPPSWSN